MVENVADDGVEPKLAKIEAFGVGVGSDVASGDFKPNLDVKFKVKIPFQAHVEEKPKPKPVPIGVRGIEVNICSFM